jgi:hypothetical protein
MSDQPIQSHTVPDIEPNGHAGPWEIARWDDLYIEKEVCGDLIIRTDDGYGHTSEQARRLAAQLLSAAARVDLVEAGHGE